MHRRRRPHDLPLTRGEHAADDHVILVPNGLAVLIGRDQLQQIHDVLTEELRSLPRQTRRQIGIADDDDAVFGSDDLARFRERTVAAQIRRAHIHDDRTRHHGRDSLSGEQQRGGAAGNLCRGDDDIALRGLVHVHLLGACLIVFIELARIAVS